MHNDDEFYDYCSQEPRELTEEDLRLVKEALEEYRPHSADDRSIAIGFAVRAMLECELEDFLSAELVDDDVCVTRLDGSHFEAAGQAARLVTNVIAEAEAVLRSTP